MAPERLSNFAVREIVLWRQRADGTFSTEDIPTSPSLRAHAAPTSLVGLRPGTMILGDDGAWYKAGGDGVPALDAGDASAFTDANSFYPSDLTGAALVALGVAIGGTTVAARNYNSNVYIADNDSLKVAAEKLDAAVGAVATSVVQTKSVTVTIGGGNTQQASAGLGMGDLSTARCVASLGQAAADASAIQFRAVGQANGTVIAYCTPACTAQVDVDVFVDVRA